MKELAGFDFEAQPSIDPKQIRDLAAPRWIANGHLSIALGTAFAFVEQGSYGEVYRYKFSTTEIKTPLQDAVTKAGWTGAAFPRKSSDSRDPMGFH